MRGNNQQRTVCYAGGPRGVICVPERGAIKRPTEPKKTINPPTSAPNKTVQSIKPQPAKLALNAKPTPKLISKPTPKKITKPKPKSKPQLNQPELVEFRKLSKVAAKADLLQRAMEKERKKIKKRPLRQRIRKHAPVVLATFALLVAGYVVVDSWIINRNVNQQLSNDQKAVAIANNTDATPEERQEAEGKDERDMSGALANYRVEASMPRAIYIDKIKAKARILPMSVNPDGSMQAPINISDAGWYTGSVKPGQKGAAIVVAHASGPTRQGLFAYVDTLNNGDRVTIERGDGSKIDYEITEKKSVPLDSVNMNEMLATHGSDEGLNLMTCGGKWLAKKKTFDERVMLFARRVR